MLNLARLSTVTMSASFTISGQLIDLHQQHIYPASIVVKNGIIEHITEVAEADDHYILPGFVDAHVHIESSMLVPTAFARMAVVHGTVATVSDPHEIANVCGKEGVEYMIRNARQSPFKCFFGAPSCVPATSFETAGAVLDAVAVNELLASPDIWYLAEMMNYPGVLNGDPEVMDKIKAAHAKGKPVDGHAPGLRGNDAKHYAHAGISTDHECTVLEEALEKIEYGMHILIREGSAAKNFEALHELFSLHPERVMLCSDDKHPDDLVLGHINRLVMRALEQGHDLFKVLRAACLHPVQHYKLPVGLLRVGDPADFIIIDHPSQLNVLQSYIDGILVAQNGQSLLPAAPAEPINHFKALPVTENIFQVRADNSAGSLQVIEALDGQLATNSVTVRPKIVDGLVVSCIDTDVLKIAVINRYEPQAKPAIAFIKGFGMKRGAIASTVAHDCHNIIAVGADDECICKAVNAVIDAKGGIAVADLQHVSCMPLPIAGLMTDVDGYETARQYAALDAASKHLGATLHTPFMTLSFMALLVIPSLKLSDKGLFDGQSFRFTPLLS